MIFQQEEFDFLGVHRHKIINTRKDQILFILIPFSQSPYFYIKVSK